MQLNSSRKFRRSDADIFRDLRALPSIGDILALIFYNRRYSPAEVQVCTNCVCLTKNAVFAGSVIYRKLYNLILNAKIFKYI